MASIRKRGKRWTAEVRIKGRYLTDTFDSKLEAQSWAIAQEQAIGKHGGLVTGNTLKDAMERYKREVSPKKKGRRWEEIRLNKLMRDPLADIVLLSLTREDIQDWINRQTVGPASINRELIVISGVLKHCRTWKWMVDNPMKDINRPKNPPPRDRLISDYERDRILLAIGYAEDRQVMDARQKLGIIFLLALETGMRWGEIWGLEWQNVHLKRKFLTLMDTKNGERRDVPLSQRAVELLQAVGSGQGQVFTGNPSSAATIFRRAVQLAGYDDIHFHDTRHSAVTRLARKLDVLDLARMIGHKDIRNLQIYYNATAEDIAGRLD